MRWANSCRLSDRGAAGSGQTHDVRVGLVIDAAVLWREAYLQRHLSGPYFGLQRSKDGRAAHLQTWSCGQRGGVEAAMRLDLTLNSNSGA
jgi:hypothetical protein